MRLRTVLAPLEDYLKKNTKNLAKPPIAMENAFLFLDFNSSFIPNHAVSTMTVPAQGQDMNVYQLDIAGTHAEPPASKKAIIHIVGNTGYVAKNMPELEPLVRTICKDTAAMGKNVKISFFCQDYRARGFNKKIDEECFNDFPVDRDAKDQSALIKKLIAEGYKPEDILIHTHSYGSGVALWMLYMLIQKEGMDYANIKLFCDRGYGNFLDFPLLDVLQTTNNPFETKDEIVRRDETYSANDLSTTHPALHFPKLGIKPHHLMQALLLEKPINMRFPFNFSDFHGFVQKYDMGNGEKIALSPHVYLEKESVTYDRTELVVKSPILGNLLRRLHQYCLEHAARALKSGVGGDFKNNYIKKIGWEAREQVVLATHLIAYLARKPSPDWKALLKYVDEKGPHHSGKLKPIFEEIVETAQEIQQLENFNKQILSLQTNRDKRLHAKSEGLAQNSVFNMTQLRVEENYSPGLKPGVK